MFALGVTGFSSFLPQPNANKTRSKSIGRIFWVAFIVFESFMPAAFNFRRFYFCPKLIHYQKRIVNILSSERILKKSVSVCINLMSGQISKFWAVEAYVRCLKWYIK